MFQYSKESLSVSPCGGIEVKLTGPMDSVRKLLDLDLESSSN